MQSYRCSVITNKVYDINQWIKEAISFFNELAIPNSESCSREFLAPTGCTTLDNLTCSFFANGRDNFGRVIFEYFRPHFRIMVQLCWLYVKQMELNSFYFISNSIILNHSIHLEICFCPWTKKLWCNILLTLVNEKWAWKVC